LKASSTAEVLAQQSDVEQFDLDSEQEDDDGDELKETVRQAGPNVKKDEDGSKPQQSSRQKRKTPKSSSKSTDEDTVRKSDYRVKTTKYYSSMPIETWLRNMEIFGRCSNIEDSKLITVAIFNLLSGDAGAIINESLDDDEMVDWKLLKCNFISSLGQSDEFYKNQFHKYQRGSNSFGLCMANFKAYFKNGYKKTYHSDDNCEAILEQFINCQNPRLKEILKRQKSQLTIENAAKKATDRLSVPIIIGLDVLHDITISSSSAFVEINGHRIETFAPQLSCNCLRISAIIETVDEENSLQKFQSNRLEIAEKSQFSPTIGSYGDASAIERKALQQLVKKFRLSFTMGDSHLRLFHYRFSLPFHDEKLTTH
jgi:hypothetical protein